MVSSEWPVPSSLAMARSPAVAWLSTSTTVPSNNDRAIDGAFRDARRLEELTRGDAPPLRVSAAYDGLEIDL